MIATNELRKSYIKFSLTSICVSYTTISSTLKFTRHPVMLTSLVVSKARATNKVVFNLIAFSHVVHSSIF